MDKNLHPKTVDKNPHPKTVDKNLHPKTGSKLFYFAPFPPKTTATVWKRIFKSRPRLQWSM